MFRSLAPGRHVFRTPLGFAGFAWTTRGVDRFALPQASADDVLAELPARTTPRPLPPVVKDLARRVRAHLSGRPDPMTDVPVDLSALTPFGRKVARALRRVPPGRTTTYGELARRAGSPGSARAVGGRMACNAAPLLVPCHRVIGADGALGAFSGPGGSRQKEHLLQLEGVTFDPVLAEGYAHLARVDRKMAGLVRTFGPYAPGFGGHASWDILVTSIVHQQLSVKAAATIAGRVCALTPGPAMPTPDEMARLSTEALRGCGLSRAKEMYVKDLSRHVRNGLLDLDALDHLDDGEVLDALTAVKGIGVWTAQMSLIFHLGRLDVWPVGDLGLRNAVKLHLGMDAAPTEKEMEPLGDRWAPYRSMAAWYLWALVDGEII